jgi:uncharacterized membrane protein YhaH (DUF805 family)
MNFETTFASPMGRTARGPFVGALIVLILAVAFYVLLVHAGRNGQWVLITLLYPAFVLHARRLHDMGKTAWLLVLPGAVFLAGVYLALFTASAKLGAEVTWAAVAVSAVFAAWGLLGKGQGAANRFGPAAG